MNKTPKNRIADLRKEKKLTLVALGKAVGMRDNTISQYETGKREPKLETWKKLADFFDVPMGYIQGYSNERSILSLDELEKAFSDNKLSTSKKIGYAMETLRKTNLTEEKQAKMELLKVIEKLDQTILDNKLNGKEIDTMSTVINLSLSVFSIHDIGITLSFSVFISALQNYLDSKNESDREELKRIINIFVESIEKNASKEHQIDSQENNIDAPYDF